MKSMFRPQMKSSREFRSARRPRCSLLSTHLSTRSHSGRPRELPLQSMTLLFPHFLLQFTVDSAADAVPSASPHQAWLEEDRREHHAGAGKDTAWCRGWREQRPPGNASGSGFIRFSSQKIRLRLLSTRVPYRRLCLEKPFQSEFSLLVMLRSDVLSVQRDF